MIVWGGMSYPNSIPLASGGRYNPSTDSWTPITNTNAPSARYGHTAVWTGTEMIIWGGYYYDRTYYFFNTGGRYNPSADTWKPTTTTDAPSARGGHTAVWTGTEMIVWGGGDNNYIFNTGGRYNPSTDTWRATPTGLLGKTGHTAVWTGTEMIIWGGYDGSYSNTGWRYDPSTDTWTSITTTGAPSGRVLHTAVWTGTEMIIWGGYYYTGGETYLNTGGRYNPSTNTWKPTTTTDAPSPREYHTAVWTGTEMIVWGGYDGFNYLNTGGRYTP
jgi:N-acetylneuraminic acid mutarotase